jgi:hypothetical protein
MSVHATANSDKPGEIALSQLGREPDIGDATNPLTIASRTDGIVEYMNPRRTPLLHLHGKVGEVVFPARLLAEQ